MYETQEHTNQQPRTGEATVTEAGQKTFTQEQLNAIVGERLAKEKTRSEAAIAERERELAQRELTLTAKERLSAKGLSADLLDALNVSSPEALEKSLSIIERVISIAPPVEITGARPASSSGKPSDRTGMDIRQAMGLK